MQSPEKDSDSPLSQGSPGQVKRTDKQTDASLAKQWLIRVKPWLKWLIIAVVLCFVCMTVYRAYVDVQSKREHLDFAAMDWRWLVLGTCVYAIGMLPAGIAWIQTLHCFKQSVPWGYGLYAYYLGLMGKYVPGKAMVIVLRAGKLHPIGVEIKPTVVSVFVETLTSVCTGALLGSTLLLTMSPPDWMRLAAIVTIPCALVMLLPHTFRAVLAILAKSRIGRMPKSVNEAFTWRLMLRTCSWMALGWCMHGTAGWLVLSGIHPAPELWTLYAWSVCVAAVSLGAVVGFASMVPGGAFVRELVITWLLCTLVAEPIALFAAIAFRIANLIAEFLMIGTLSIAVRCSKQPNSPIRS
jgi:uncharacterized membrane protein YbhN (UPF0104 family)